ncbi:unnamed protein product, partial [Amoebophrya sp. A25]
ASSTCELAAGCLLEKGAKGINKKKTSVKVIEGKCLLGRKRLWPMKAVRKEWKGEKGRSPS